MRAFFGEARWETWWLAAFYEIGILGVDLFFVLSGFLIYKLCISEPLAPWRYAWRRVERIYPVFAVVLGAYLLFSLLFPHAIDLPDSTEDRLAYIVANILLLPGVFDIEPIVPVAWSLSYEAGFYILAPIAVVGLGMRRWRSWHRCSLFLGIYAVAVALHMRGELTLLSPSMFVGGLLLYEYRYHLRPASAAAARSRFAESVCLVLLAVALVLFTLLGHNRWMIETTPLGALPSSVRHVFLLLAFTFLVDRCLFAAGGVSRMFSWKPLRWLGNMSYSYYLCHAAAIPACLVLVQICRPEWSADRLVFVYLILPVFAATVALSLPIYVWVERPLSLRPHVSSAVASIGGRITASLRSVPIPTAAEVRARSG
jgi:peptidoglycan/LPS O-acetylase OafA/YrhL